MEPKELYVPINCGTHPIHDNRNDFAGYYWGFESDDEDILSSDNEVLLFKNDVIFCLSDLQEKKYYNFAHRAYIPIMGHVCLFKQKKFFIESQHTIEFKKIS